jgi:hypothetical protein
MRVRALHDVYYNGNNYKPGDEFDVQDEHGHLMAMNESVAQITTRDMRASEAGNSKRRDYRRRDMRSDE